MKTLEHKPRLGITINWCKICPVGHVNLADGQGYPSKGMWDMVTTDPQWEYERMLLKSGMVEELSV